MLGGDSSIISMINDLKGGKKSVSKGISEWEVKLEKILTSERILVNLPQNFPFLRLSFITTTFSRTIP